MWWSEQSCTHYYRCFFFVCFFWIALRIEIPSWHFNVAVATLVIIKELQYRVFCITSSTMPLRNSFGFDSTSTYVLYPISFCLASQALRRRIYLGHLESFIPVVFHLCNTPKILFVFCVFVSSSYAALMFHFSAYISLLTDKYQYFDLHNCAVLHIA